MAVRPLPKTLAIIAGFLFFATAMAVLVGGALLFPGKLLLVLAELNRPGMAAFEHIQRLAGLLLLLLGVACFVIALGLLRRKKWAWVAAIALFIVNGGGDVVSCVRTHDILRSGTGVMIAAVFLFALSRRGASRFFSAQV